MTDIAELEKQLEDLLNDKPAADDQTAQAAQAAQAEPAQATAQPRQNDDLAAQLMAEVQGLKQAVSDAAKAKEEGEGDNLDIDVPKLSDEELGTLAQYRDKLEKVAKAATGSEMKKLLDELRAVKQQLSQLAEQTVAVQQNTFAQTLRAAIPDIDALTTDPKFSEYLQQRAPFSGGRTLAQLLDEAYQAQDLMRVQEIVQGYKQNVGQAEEPTLPTNLNRPAATNARGSRPQPEQHSGDMLDKFLEARRKVTAAYRKREIGYDKYVELIGKIGEREALLTKGEDVARIIS